MPKDTNKQHPQEWKSRREIPNPSIKDAADQYEQARLILNKHLLPGTGVLLPMMNAAGMAIELYLKCLAAEVIHIPEKNVFGTGMPEIDKMQSYKVHAKANEGGHKFNLILDKIEDSIQCRLESSYGAKAERSFREDLSKIDGVLVKSRNPYEPENDPPSINFQTLMSLSAFLRRFVANLEPRETIQWKDENTT